MIYTAMVEVVDDERRKLRRDIAPLGTEGTAEDIAMAAVYLASDESKWVTGVLLPVDAGLMAAGPQAIIGNIMEDDRKFL
jgi:NAD(P)-dependent dehydrogenase (short-subunit alcohol dehydrogenase family)